MEVAGIVSHVHVYRNGRGQDGKNQGLLWLDTGDSVTNSSEGGFYRQESQFIGGEMRLEARSRGRESRISPQPRLP